MSTIKRGNLTIFIFPYLFLDKEIEVFGYKLKPSYSTVVNKESKRIRGHLSKIARSFKLPRSSNIFQYTYGWVTLHNNKEWEQLKKFLNEYSTLLCYNELSSERSGANYTNFDHVVFEIYRPMSRLKHDYYQGALNGRTQVNIHYPETKFCPNQEIRPYLLNTDVENKVLGHLLPPGNAFFTNEEKGRLIRAIEWFNKSHKSDPEVDDIERYTSLAIAFEALFNSPPESIQANLSANISSLLGETPEMTHWVRDFYDQRSKIVHGKEEPSTLYRGKNSSEFHLNHLVFARKVFTSCVRALFVVRTGIYSKSLHQELISNERRIKESLQILRTKKNMKDLHLTNVFDTIDSLSQKDPTGKTDDVIEIGKLLLPMTKTILRQSKRKDLESKMDEIVSYSKTDLGELAVLYSDFHSGFSSVYFGDKTIKFKEIYKLAFKGAVYNLTSYMVWKLFREAFNKKK